MINLCYKITVMAILIEYKENTGFYNMEFDRKLLDFSIKNKRKEPVLRFYGWNPPCLSIGRNQSFEHINMLYCQNNGIDIVKRETGGRGLLHDDELTYSFICPIDILKCGDNIISSYKEISSAIIEGFKTINIELDFGKKKQLHTSCNYCMLLSTGADLCYNGRKLIGSAQYRKQGYILQHGSILFSYKENLLKNIFNEEIQRNTITSIKEINPRLTRKDIADAILSGFNNNFSTFSPVSFNIENGTFT